MVYDLQTDSTMMIDLNEGALVVAASCRQKRNTGRLQFCMFIYILCVMDGWMDGWMDDKVKRCDDVIESN